MIQNITVIRTPEDCPYASVGMNDMKNKTRKWVRLSFELTSAIHPRGRCCQASIPEPSSNWDLGGVLVEAMVHGAAMQALLLSDA